MSAPAEAPHGHNKHGHGGGGKSKQSQVMGVTRGAIAETLLFPFSMGGGGGAKPHH